VGQAKRQAATAMAKATKNILVAWTDGLAPPPKTRKRKRR
jgi:hypothetical protein